MWWWLTLGAAFSLAVPVFVMRHWGFQPVDHQGSFWGTVEYEVAVRVMRVGLILAGMAITIAAWPLLIAVAVLGLWQAYRAAVWNERADRYD